MANYTTCKRCGAKLMADDIAIYRKMVTRNADEFFCIDCLADYFHCEKQAILDRIQYYRESGTCTLFRS